MLGVDIALERTVGSAGGGTLVLDADIGIGEATVVVCGGGGQPCP